MHSQTFMLIHVVLAPIRTLVRLCRLRIVTKCIIIIFFFLSPAIERNWTQGYMVIWQILKTRNCSPVWGMHKVRIVISLLIIIQCRPVRLFPQVLARTLLRASASSKMVIRQFFPCDNVHLFILHWLVEI